MQVQSSNVGGSVKGVAEEDEGQQQLSVLAPSVWEQLLDMGSFGAGVWHEPEEER